MAESRLEVAIEDILEQSSFDAALLTDLQANVLASIKRKDLPPDASGILMQVAMQVATRDEDRVRLAEAGESEFFDWEGRRVVCRWIEARTPTLLVVLVPKAKSYKWAVGRMVKEVQRLIGR
jgi:hypothetical protein